MYFQSFAVLSLAALAQTTYGVTRIPLPAGASGSAR